MNDVYFDIYKLLKDRGSHLHHVVVLLVWCYFIQESCAIAKMTDRAMRAI